MKLFKTALVVLVLLVNLVVAQPSWADRPNLTRNPDYIEVTQALDNLLQAKDNPDQSETGKTLAVYAYKTKKTGSDQNTLLYLGNGKITDNDWNCDGVYLPSGVKVAGLTPADSQVQ